MVGEEFGYDLITGVVVEGGEKLARNTVVVTATASLKGDHPEETGDASEVLVKESTRTSAGPKVTSEAAVQSVEGTMAVESSVGTTSTSTRPQETGEAGRVGVKGFLVGALAIGGVAIAL